MYTYFYIIIYNCMKHFGIIIIIISYYFGIVIIIISIKNVNYF